MPPTAPLRVISSLIISPPLISPPSRPSDRSGVSIWRTDSRHTEHNKCGLMWRALHHNISIYFELCLRGISLMITPSTTCSKSEHECISPISFICRVVGETDPQMRSITSV